MEPLPELRDYFSMWETGRPAGSTAAGFQCWKSPIYRKPLHMNLTPGTGDVSSFPVPCHQGMSYVGMHGKSNAEGLNVLSGPYLEKMDTKINCLRFLWRRFTHCRSKDPTRPNFAETGAEQGTEQAPTCQECPHGYQLPTSSRWLQPMCVIPKQWKSIKSPSLPRMCLNPGNQWASKRFTRKYQASIYWNDTFVFWRKYTWKKMETNNIWHLFLPCNYSGTLNFCFLVETRKCIMLKKIN